MGKAPQYHDFAVQAVKRGCPVSKENPGTRENPVSVVSRDVRSCAAPIPRNHHAKCHGPASMQLSVGPCKEIPDNTCTGCGSNQGKILVWNWAVYRRVYIADPLLEGNIARNLPTTKPPCLGMGAFLWVNGKIS